MVAAATIGLLASAPTTAAAAAPTLAPNLPASTDAALPAGLPAIGKWSIGADGQPAHWLGALYLGKALREPINVILVDDISVDAAQATARVIAAAKQAGYPVRQGHSTGYQGLVGGIGYTQLPAGKDFAFSNRPFEFDNNHGRIFGPHRVGTSWVFTAAFSRESVSPLGTPKHRYASFNQARDDFTERMDQFTNFKIVRFVALDNAIVGDRSLTTGDHDSVGVVLKAPRP